MSRRELEEAKRRLLDFSQPLDLELFDDVSRALGSGSPESVSASQEVLMGFREAPEAWTVVDHVIDSNCSVHAKFLAAQILVDLIAFKWYAIQADVREGVKSFITEKIMFLCSDEEIYRSNQLLLTKMNLALVEVLKKEWTNQWSTFIPEITEMSKSSEIICTNTMEIFCLLSEEIFDFSEDRVTQGRVEELKEHFNQEFGQIFELCNFVFVNSQNTDLVAKTLRTLTKFSTWIPPGFLFETDILEDLTTKFFPYPAFRNPCLECLIEIVTISDQRYTSQIRSLFTALLDQLMSMITADQDFHSFFMESTEEEQNFFQNLCHFLCTLFKTHLHSLEIPDLHNYVVEGHAYLVALSRINHDEIFKECLEYWLFLAQDLYESRRPPRGGTRGLMVAGDGYQRIRTYETQLSFIRSILIERMAKPEEVIIVLDEYGQPRRMRVDDNVDSLQHFQMMRDTLVYLTHLDPRDMDSIMIGKLKKQMSGEEWSWENLNKLCWAIGAISGAMDVQMEKNFLVFVIKDLLELCANKRGKENKAVVASNIMYVVGQYPRFLIDHWRFLKTVSLKLFEFMRELFPGVQEMSVDTFLKITKTCKREFVVSQPEDDTPVPFVNIMLEEIGNIIELLQPEHIQVFYEAAGHIISAEPDPNLQVTFLGQLLSLPNDQWSEIISAVQEDVGVLADRNTCRDLVNILRTNSSTARGVGPAFMSQLSNISTDALNLYQAYSRMINETVVAKGPQAVSHSDVRAWRKVKPEILNMVETFFQHMSPDDMEVIVQSFIPALLSTVLDDYSSSVCEARDAEALSLVDVIVKKFKGFMLNQIPDIMGVIFEPTLELITDNMTDFPQHRQNFFALLRSINKHCFGAFFELPMENFRVVVQSILWAMKHMEHSISDTGHTTLLEMVRQLSGTPYAEPFYENFLMSVVSDVLVAMTDMMHKTALPFQVGILHRICGDLSSGNVTCAVGEDQPSGMSSLDYVRESLFATLKENFSNMSEADIRDFLVNLFDPTISFEDLKVHVRDFIIKSKEFSPDEASAYYLDDDKSQRQAAEMEEKARRDQVPGLSEPDVSME